MLLSPVIWIFCLKNLLPSEQRREIFGEALGPHAGLTRAGYLLFDSPHLRFNAKKNLATIRFLGEAIKDIGAKAKSYAKLKKEFESC